jgi:hypothetical protein
MLVEVSQSFVRQRGVRAERALPVQPFEDVAKQRIRQDREDAVRGMYACELRDQQPLCHVSPACRLKEDMVGIREYPTTTRAGRAASVDDLEKEEVGKTTSATGL